MTLFSAWRRIAARTLVVVGLLGGAALVGPVGSASAADLGHVMLVNRQANLCAVVAPDQYPAPVVLGPCTYNRGWAHEQTASISRFSTGNGACLATKQGSRDHGTELATARCLDNTTNPQFWTLSQPDTYGHVTISLHRRLLSDPPSDLCMDTSYARTTAGTPVVIGRCTGSGTQKWLVQRVPSSW